MKKIAILLGFCMVVAFLPTFISQPVAAMTGSGTVGDPYVIYDVTDLQNMNFDLDAYYVLGNDIDASATSGWNGGAGFVPIGTTSTPFAGHLNGNGTAITDLYIYRPSTSYVGLFGYIYGSAGTHATVSNLTLTASVSGAVMVGALAGEIRAYADVSYCEVWSTIDGDNSLGGFAGNIRSSTVTYCGATTYLTATVAGQNGGFVGGICKSMTISSCYANGEVHYVGASTSIGGFIGQTDGTGTITNCYSRCDVYASGTPQRVGGFSGMTYTTTIDNCYSTGFVSGFLYVGGFQGGGSCTDCFWDVDTSEKGTSACGTGKSTSEMKTQSTFTDAGWDFDDVWSIGGYINDGYPYFEWWYNPPDIISDVNQVVWFQPNTIIEGSILPNRAQGGTLQDGEFTWGANPEGITISHGELIPEEEYDFEPVIPGGQDIINPEPETMTGDVDTERLHNNPLYPFVQVLSIAGFLNERLVWLGLAWFILIAAMFGVHLGFDTKKDTEKPQHFILTTITGLGLSIMFYTMGIFPWWVILLMAFGLIGAIIWERQPVL